MTARQVIIADARFTDGKPNSRVYHNIVSRCLRDGEQVMRLEVTEDVAQAFGFTFCRTCQRQQETQEAISFNQKLIDELTDALPDDLELRIYRGRKIVYSSRNTERST